MAITLGESEIEKINTALMDLLKQSEGKCALLVDQDGQCLVRKGFTKTFDCDAVAALIAGSFASTRALAELVGESEFSVLFHQGDNDHIHNILVDEDAILAVLFDERTTVGMIRLYSKEAVKEIRQILMQARESAPPPGKGGGSQAAEEAMDRIDTIFDE